MPPGKTATAAGACRVLGSKNRVPPHRGLPAVTFRQGRTQPFGQELLRVLFQSLPAPGLCIGPVFGVQAKTAAKT